MVRKRDGDEESTNVSIKLYPSELASIQPGPMDWPRLMLKIQAMKTFGEKGWMISSPLSSLAQKAETGVIVSLCESINSDIRRWIDGYVEHNSHRVAVLGFKYHWKIIRVWVSLQLRLAVEQVLYEKGPPWSNLVTGFGAIK